MATIFDKTNCSNATNKSTSKMVDTLLSDYTLVWDCFFSGATILLGFIGNIISFMVLSRDRIKGTTNFILRCLAIFDTLFLFGSLFFQPLDTLSQRLKWNEYNKLKKRYLWLLWGSGQTVRMMRNWTVVMVSTERWIAVCKPLRAQTICTKHNMRIGLFFVIILSIFYNLPRFFYVTTEEQLIPCTNQTELKMIYLIKHRVYEIGYNVVGYLILMVIGPTFILMIFNILLICGVQNASVERKALTMPSDMKRATSRNAEITRLCIGVVMVYLLCELPALIYQIMRNSHLDFTKSLDSQQMPYYLKFYKPVSNFLVTLQSGTNFFIYVFFGRRFRKQLKDMCCGRTAPARGGFVSSARYTAHSSSRAFQLKYRGATESEKISTSCANSKIRYSEVAL